jgi:PAT family beta-lactamase induction signal transducer AmpG
MQPHSVEAEQSVLGGLLLSSDGWDAVAEAVTAQDFYRPDHRLIFRQIHKLAEASEPVDVITVADKLTANGELEAAGGLGYLAELASNTPSASNIRAYAQVVSERASLRKLIEAAQDIAEKIQRQAAHRAHLPPRLARFTSWFYVAIAGPFVDFFQRYRELAVAILLLVAVYRVSDIAMGVMANPFYLTFMGFSKTEVADVTKIFGFFMTIGGSLLGGLLVIRYGVRRILLLGAIMTALTNLLFVVLAQYPPNLATLAVVVSADNLSGGIANVALIAWLSSMTSASFTATQYALFSSLMTLPGKFLGGFSGMVVASYGYAEFFLVAGLLGVPAIVLAMFMMRHGKRLDALAPDNSGSENAPASDTARE